MNAKLKALGRIAGAPDYVFIGKDKTLLLEFKTKTGVLSKNQKAFQSWSEDNGVDYRIVRSFEDAESILREVGLLVG